MLNIDYIARAAFEALKVAFCTVPSFVRSATAIVGYGLSNSPIAVGRALCTTRDRKGRGAAQRDRRRAPKRKQARRTMHAFARSPPPPGHVENQSPGLSLKPPVS